MKSHPSLHERLLANIAPVYFQQIEAIDTYGDMSAVEEGEEVGTAMNVASDQFAIDDARLCR